MENCTETSLYGHWMIVAKKASQGGLRKLKWKKNLIDSRKATREMDPLFLILATKDSLDSGRNNSNDIPSHYLLKSMPN